MERTVGIAVAILTLALVSSHFLRREGGPSAPPPPAEPTTTPVAVVGVKQVVTPPPTPLPLALNEAEQAKLRMLIEIFAAKNDNDPRLDREFKALTPGLKSGLSSLYRSLPTESRNERGTIVFLLGRSIATREDVAFFAGVLREPPCLSLADCGRGVSPGGVDEHAAMAGEMTLVYPQMVTLRSFEKILSSRVDGGVRAGILESLHAALGSESAHVAGAARELLAKYGP